MGRLRTSFLPLCFAVCALPVLNAQDEEEAGNETTVTTSSLLDSGKPLKLDISRRFLKNFLTDEVALIPHQDKDGKPLDFQGVFMIGAVKSSHAVFWDPRSCRLLGALNLNEESAPENPEEKNNEATEEEDAQSPYTLLASGPHPFNGSRGAFETPKYFGFRIVGGRPEFLYTFGSLQIEEQIWLENDGRVLKVQFRVKGATSDYSLSIPKDWKARSEASTGEWKDNQLTVPGDEESELLLAFSLEPNESGQPAETEN